LKSFNADFDFQFIVRRPFCSLLKNKTIFAHINNSKWPALLHHSANRVWIFKSVYLRTEKERRNLANYTISKGTMAVVG
jgi:hypothetical protein